MTKSVRAKLTIEGCSDLLKGISFLLQGMDLLNAFNHICSVELIASVCNIGDLQQTLLCPVTDGGVRHTGVLCQLANLQKSSLIRI